MKTFDSFNGLATELTAIAVAEGELQRKLLDRAGAMIQNRAKKKIGDLQPEAPPFVAWAPLSEAYLERKEKISAFPLNGEGNPLLLTGEMRDSIERTIEGHSAHVGSDNDKAVWHELGTDKMPPRSFLGSSAAELAPKIARMIGRDLFLALQGKDVVNGLLRIK